MLNTLYFFPFRGNRLVTDEERAEESTHLLPNLDLRDRRGLGYMMAAFFLVAQMAGAGFLALPKAMADAGKSITF